MTARELQGLLEKYTGSPFISTRQICEIDGTKNRSRVIRKYGLNDLPRFGGKYGKFSCMDVAENMISRRVV